MLGIHQQEVVPGLGHQFRGIGRSQAEEGPDNGLAGFKFGPEAHQLPCAIVFRPRLTSTSTICRR